MRPLNVHTHIFTRSSSSCSSSSFFFVYTLFYFIFIIGIGPFVFFSPPGIFRVPHSLKEFFSSCSREHVITLIITQYLFRRRRREIYSRVYHFVIIVSYSVRVFSYTIYVVSIHKRIRTHYNTRARTTSCHKSGRTENECEDGSAGRALARVCILLCWMYDVDSTLIRRRLPRATVLVVVRCVFYIRYFLRTILIYVTRWRATAERPCNILHCVRTETTKRWETVGDGGRGGLRALGVKVRRLLRSPSQYETRLDRETRFFFGRRVRVASETRGHHNDGRA